MPFVWSPGALDDLHRLYVQERRSAAETAKALGAGVTRNAVLGKVQRLGWTRGPAEPKPPPPKRPAPRLVVRVRAPRSPFSGRIPLPKLREITVIGTPRLWTEREDGQCAFPVGEPVQPGLQLSCCAPTRAGGAYCPAHRMLMTLPDSVMTAKDQDSIAEIARRAA